MAKTFYIDNRSEIGDTLSLIPLLKALRDEHPDAAIHVKQDPHHLLDNLAGKPMDKPPEGAEVWRQTPNHHEYGDYYRRVDDFYYYPIRMAKLLGWLKKDYPEQPEIPAVLVKLPTSLKAATAHLKDYVVVAPEANMPARSWPQARWKNLVRWLLNHGERVVVVGRNKFQFDPSVMHNHYVDLTQRTTVKEMATIVHGAKLLVGLDSSPAHFAMGHHVPAIVLQGPTGGAPTFRYDRVRSVVRSEGDCINCYQRVESDKPYREGEQPSLYTCGNTKSPPCMDKISVASVINAVSEELWNTVPEVRLSVCIMVKNEAKLIKPCLESARIAADEVILMDTGSTDDTIEIAKQFPKVKVYENTKVGFENGLISDFAAARNFVFAKATGKYVLWVDAGDRIADPKKLREEILAERADVVFMNTVIGQTSFRRERVCLREFAQFEYRVHEVMNIDGLSSIDSQTHMEHVGSTKMGREQSLTRNTRLLKRMLKEQPDDPSRWRWYYYLGRDLKNDGHTQESIQYLRRARDGQGFFEERAHAAIEVARSCMKLEKYNEACDAAYEALRICDGWRDPYYLAGEAYFWAGKYDKAIPWYTHCLGIPRPQTTLWLWEDLYTYLPQCQLSYCYERLGNFNEALYWCVEESKEAPQQQQERIEKRIMELEAKGADVAAE